MHALKSPKIPASPRQRLGALLAGFTLAVLAAGSAQANVDIADSPLFVTSSVDPNLVFVIDDSGSMQWETMPDELTKYHGAALANEAVMWVYPPVANLHGGTAQYDSRRTVRFSGNNAAMFRSPHNNTVYYNPAVTYRPWSNADGSLMPAADPTSAPNRPLFPAFGTRNLTVDNTQNSDWLQNSAGGNSNNTSVTFYPAVYYHYESGPIDQESSYTRVEIRNTTPLYTDHGRENRTDCSDVLGGVCTYAEEIQNFANWYSYHRNRIFASRAGIGRAFAAQGEGVRVGYGAINKGSTSIDNVATATVVSGVRPFGGASRTAFFNELYTRPVPAASTPLRNALKGVGEYFKRTDARGPWSTTPGSAGGVDLTCRQSFAILMSDGYWNGPNPNVGNTDGAGTVTHTGPGGITGGYAPSEPFRDNRSNTLADVAMEYWKNDLRPDLANRVPASTRNPAFWQHMVTYTVGLGVQGAIDPATAFAAILTGDTVNWPNPTAGDSEKIDDMLHAAVNGRGGFFSAADAETFANELAAVLADIVARVESSATSAATSSAVLQTETLLYTAGFRSGDWSGQLTARNVNPDGSVGTLAWDAEHRLSLRAPSSRNIVTRRNDTGVAVAFTFAGLSPAQQAALNHGPSGTNDGLGPERVAWLRGDESGSFRDRSETTPRLLGDIINSNPKFNDGVLYVGANDGMLHAFDADTGDELFAYIPSTLLTPQGGDSHAPLSELMDPDYAHRYFVDGTPSVLDLSFAGIAQTVLVGSMGAGGRTIFALDVTNPASFGPGNVMWEFSHPELGYNVGPPAIVQLNNGDLAAVFGNGYNSQSNRAMLFVVNLTNGNLIQTIDTGEGSAGSPNGLAAPVATDWPVSNLKVNRVYAGDLHGNLWRFNMGGAPSTWNDAGNVSALFAARSAGGVAQPITASPVVALNPANNNEVVVAFGTGSYFRTSDQNVQGQTLYGILDTKTGENNVARADLLAQTITSTTYTVGEDTIGVRIVSENEFDPTFHKGWLVDLPEAGERVITEATFPSGPTQRRVRFSTLIPDEDPCGTGRRGYLMDLDLVAGGRVQYSVFDLNRDGSYDEGDMIGDAPVSGVAWGQGERPTLLTPADQSGDPPEFLYTGEGEYVKGLGEEGIGGRQSWQQLR